MMNTAYESLEFDILIVGAGPAGLCAAIHAAQLSAKHELNWSIAVVEKSAELGGHIVSGAIMDPIALHELLPNWQNDAPVEAIVGSEHTYHLTQKSALTMPHWLLPSTLDNTGCYVIRLGALVRWLGEQAEALGVEILTGFSAHSLLIEQDTLKGVVTGNMGVARDGQPKESFTQGYQLLAKHTLLAEGCRGHLGKQAIEAFALEQQSNPEHYGIGFKEIWQLPESPHPAGTVIHTIGYPLDNHTEGGGFVYFLQNNQVALGLIVSLNYTNPHLSPFEEFNRWKQHPKIRTLLTGAERIAYSARALNKGGLYSQPQATFKGGMLVGCEAGMLNPARIKGIHCAIKHGMLAAQTLAQRALDNHIHDYHQHYQQLYQASWLYKEHYQARNFRGLIQRFGTLLGGALFTIEHRIFRSKLPWQWHDTLPDHQSLIHQQQAPLITYPKPDGIISFDRLSSIYLANLSHEEDQPCHLQLSDANIPISKNLPEYAEPAQRYCPAAVYEITSNEKGEQYLRINAQNCIHCKTCDIKDPYSNITWLTPEGGSGPNYAGL